MKIYFSSILFLFLLGVFSGCYYDKEEVLYFYAETCDTSAVTFSHVIQPILQNKCTSCHGGTIPSAGIDLSSYANVLTYAQNGKLIGSIEHKSGYTPMPEGTPKIPACEIYKIKIWVKSGSPNN